METDKHKIKEIKHVLDEMDGTVKEKCTICKFVLIFAFIGLLLVLLFVFFFKSNNTEVLKPLPPELVPPISKETRDREMLELGKLFHPELSTSTSPASTEVSTSTQQTPSKK